MTFPAVAIRKRLREVLLDGSGNVRTVPASRVYGDSVGVSSTDARIHRQTLIKPRIHFPPLDIERGQKAESEPSNRTQYQIGLTIEATYRLPEEILDDDTRDGILAVAEEDSVYFREALGWPGNLAQTEAAAATGIVSGQLRFESFGTIREDWPGRVLITRHRYTGTVVVTMAIA